MQKPTCIGQALFFCPPNRQPADMAGSDFAGLRTIKRSEKPQLLGPGANLKQMPPVSRIDGTAFAMTPGGTRTCLPEGDRGHVKTTPTQSKRESIRRAARAG